MELRQLTCFLTAAQTQNFRKAAELCLIAQPALSRQIAALEAELGVELFSRVKQRVVLTDAGREFAQYVRNALDTLQQGQQEMSKFQQGESGTVLLGSNQSMATAFLPRIFTAFHQRYPQILVRVRGANSSEVISLVEHGQIDLGFAFDPRERSETVTVKELFRQPLNLLVAANHPLAREPLSTLTLERIISEPLFLLGEVLRLRQVLERIFIQRGLAVRPVVEIDSIEGLKELVRQGNGVTITLPALHQANEANLVLRPIADAPEEFIFALVYRRLGELTPTARKFIAVVAETIVNHR
ncbi:MAG TPA: LysR family transcriptional regulator [Ktedonobacteraceae bacterium]